MEIENSDGNHATLMNIREQFEERERGFISPFGCLSAENLGRRKQEPKCSIRTDFQIDRERIVFSSAFRRLKYKTQVFLAPSGDVYRTRLTHTLEVAQIAKTIARAMFLNEDLTEAIALGHDLGHTPFGHSGESVLQTIHSRHFTHQKQSLRVVDVIENRGKGLNLTFEVRDGILKHSKGCGDIIPKTPKDRSATLEGQIVRVADIMAYLNHDLDDAIQSKVISFSDLPKDCIGILGDTHTQRATTMIRDLIFSSGKNGNGVELKLSDDVFNAMKTLRQFLYEKVYRSDVVHNEFVKSKKILSDLYLYFLNDEEALLKELRKMSLSGLTDLNPSRSQLTCDLIASMTDRYALSLYRKLFFPLQID